jgi:hypothetical protein
MSWIARLRGMLNRQRLDRELDEELRSHVACSAGILAGSRVVAGLSNRCFSASGVAQAFLAVRPIQCHAQSNGYSVLRF